MVNFFSSFVFFFSDYGDHKPGVGSTFPRTSKLDSPTKHVTFLGANKENEDWYSLDIPEAPSNDAYRKMETKHTRNMIDLRTKMRQAKLKSEEFRKGDVLSRLHSRIVTAIR